MINALRIGGWILFLIGAVVFFLIDPREQKALGYIVMGAMVLGMLLSIATGVVRILAKHPRRPSPPPSESK